MREAKSESSRRKIVRVSLLEEKLPYTWIACISLLLL